MIENVIVTVVAEELGFSADMELPAQFPIGKLSVMLLEALKEIDSEKFGEVEEISLMCDGEALPGDATLESEAVWDGKVLMVR